MYYLMPSYAIFKSWIIHIVAWLYHQGIDPAALRDSVGDAERTTLKPRMTGESLNCWNWFGKCCRNSGTPQFVAQHLNKQRVFTIRYCSMWMYVLFLFKELSREDQTMNNKQL